MITQLPKIRLSCSQNFKETEKILQNLNLGTVCQEAHCPNRSECWNDLTATFLLLGKNCSRNCNFCAVQSNPPEALDNSEPERVGKAISEMKIKYAVLTSVTRDDLPDGGIQHYVDTITAIRKYSPHTLVEILTPDFLGQEKDALAPIAKARPTVWAHNLECVRRLTTTLRDPKANYDYSLKLLQTIKALDPSIYTKSSLMLGVGENREDLKAAFHDLRSVGCDFLTLGQYLRPTPKNAAVVEYLKSEHFQDLQELAYSYGFLEVIAGPLVRSSYRAHQFFSKSSSPKNIKLTSLDLGCIEYEEGLKKQLEMVELVAKGECQTILFCSHPPVVTLGKNSEAHDLGNFSGKIFHIGRGGKATYHGPSQLIIYPILNLQNYGRDIHLFLRTFEEALVYLLREHYNITATGSSSTTPGDGKYTGVWVGQRKLASIGVAIRRWITHHGMAINLDYDANAFQGINPCGFTSETMISMEELLGSKVNRKIFKEKFQNILINKYSSLQC
ncbi:MAG: lipoyl synthase [Oligoflexia bacterium]|nr:lipoyl synthase [Oligoflexia bacterium]